MSKRESQFLPVGAAKTKARPVERQLSSRPPLGRAPGQTLRPKLLKPLTWLSAFCAVSVLTSCSTTHIHGARTAAGISAPPIRKIMVVGLNARPAVRAQFESDLVYFLQQRNTVALGSSSRFPLSDFQGDEVEVQKLCATAGTDSLLLVRTTDWTTFETGPGYERTAGLGAIETAVQLKAVLYQASDGVAIWTGTVTTILKAQYDPRVVLREVAKAIVNGLATDNLIP